MILWGMLDLCGLFLAIVMDLLRPRVLVEADLNRFVQSFSFFDLTY